ncbi:MAG: bifunctional glutamine-synthetase adenylyltransferase/deadenyltransferase, partial [Frankiales bacterium]|nr:bifunctional glutamine-synthetase adenylyltransferase/deadenyltransferase [Frankiales bacterium]
MSVPGRRSGGSGRLVRLGFTDLVAADRGLRALELWDDQGPREDRVDVVDALADTAEPDLALGALVRVVEAGAPGLLAALAQDAVLRTRLLRVLGASVALGDHLAAHPQDWEVVRDDAAADARPSAYGLQAQLLEAVGADPRGAPTWGTGGARASGTGHDVVDALRAAYRRCLLRLAARDLTGAVALEDVAGELADLAAATLTAGLAVALAGLPQDAAPCRLAVIGMGKTGGRELNYVSDVDVVFVAEPVDGSSDEQAVRTATRLASAMVRICGEVAWPVDAALRPEGASGPLVRTLASHEAYYKRWASTWEFQALLKARPVAGDLGLGQDYVQRLAPLVWRAGERPGFVADVQAMRRRVEDTLKGDQADRELKLGRGGLRDIEFAVQLLQLVHGRADASLRSGTTLLALEALARGGYVAREDARHLAEAYRWLRTVEHRLQLHRLRRTHLLPGKDDEAALRRIARACGYRSSTAGDVLPVFARERAGYGL